MTELKIKISLEGQGQMQSQYGLSAGTAHREIAGSIPVGPSKYAGKARGRGHKARTPGGNKISVRRRDATV